MIDKNSTLIYLDTNAYSRPFDDQTQIDIQAEANAFLEIMPASIDEIYNRVTSWKASQS